MVHSQERAAGRRLVSFGMVCGSVLFAACGQLSRDFSTPVETAGATATGGQAHAGIGGAKSSTDRAGQDGSGDCLSWFTAAVFCIWDGGRLPTLVEWSYAAVGGAQQRYYPWSSPPNDTTISNNASYDCLGDGTTGCALTDLLRVGSKKDGLGRWLQADLGGNVSEWVLDWYIDTPPSPCKDCANFDPGTGTGKFRQILGGSFEKNAFNQQNGGASSTQPVNTMYMVGARCARN